MTPAPTVSPPHARWVGPGVFAVLLAVGLAVGLVGVNDTGPLWPDAPRYANAGSMIHDWLPSGRLADPLGFAQDNYSRYPAFSIPYHPPGYPAVLGVWFTLFGESYLSARWFVALCWGLAGWLFYRLVRHLGATRLGGLAAGLLLLTTPPLAVWARDTMSDVPSLVPLFAAAVCWVRWLARGRWYDAVGAAVLVEVAFFFRVTTAGVLPGLLLFGLLSGQIRGWRRLLGVGVFCLLYLGLNVLWVKFAAKYASYEMAADGKGGWSADGVVAFFRECGIGAFMCGSAAVAAAGLAAAWQVPAHRRQVVFWLCWGGSYLLFKVAVPTSPEVRHLFTAVPALAGLAAAAFTQFPRWRVTVGVLTVAGLVANVWGLWATTTAGVVGFEPVAQHLARSDRPGNVLIACWEDQDLIFRYRSADPARERYMIRSDRTLAVRAPDYANKADEVKGHTAEDVFALVRDGKVGYVVTWTPFDGATGGDKPDLTLAHTTVVAHPERFRHVGTFPVTVGYVAGVHRSHSGHVWVWEVLGEVADGPPDIPVLIPTAGMTLRP